MNKLKTIMIIAGGSGGHVFPGLSVARYLLNYGYKIVWIGTSNNIESKLVPKHGIDIKFIQIQGWRGQKVYKKLIILLFCVCLAVYQSLRIIQHWKPDIVLGMGGYVSGPGGFAAWLYGVPLIIHEQNKVMGLTNRCLSIFSKKVLQGFPTTKSQGKIVGNPLRDSILSVPNPCDRYRNRIGPIRVLVIGGSKGASIFNVIIPKVAENLLDKIIIWHQSGYHDLQNVVQSYQQINRKNNYKIESFIDNMDQAYAWADVVISRSGALTVSEIACIGLPAIFVPFVYHKDYQQYWNALTLVKVGSAKIVEEKNFTIDYISNILKSWDRNILLNMALKSKTLAMPNSTQLVAQTIIQFLKK